MLTPDFEQMWQRLAPDFMADAIREFNGYPEVVLAWSAYLGAAVAWCWDKDWTAYKDMDYAFFCGEKGFDYMDEHITEDILGYKLGARFGEAVNRKMRPELLGGIILLCIGVRILIEHLGS